MKHNADFGLCTKPAKKEVLISVFTLDQFHRTYETVITPVTIAGQSLTFFKPQSRDRFIDSRTLTAGFPLWAKIWEASAVLACYLVSLPPDPSKRMLEIGCGLGLVGIAAARAGHRVTMTEIDTDAINFARANTLVNGCPEVGVELLDWHAPELKGRFDYIVGSETTYKPEDIDALESLFDRYLKPGGTIILATKVRSTGVDFWERMRHGYHIQVRKQKMRSDQGEEHLLLFRLQSKNQQ